MLSSRDGKTGLTKDESGDFGACKDVVLMTVEANFVRVFGPLSIPAYKTIEIVCTINFYVNPYHKTFK